jgi:prepilin-type N-terminal cleavage/methylation domain-containing protein
MLRRGFTIIELLVVITVIAVLVSVILPVMGKAREEASHLVCQAELRGQGVAMNAYAADFKGWYPYGTKMWDNGSDWGPISGMNTSLSFQQYYTYLGQMRPFFCPTFNHFYWPGKIDNPYQVQKNYNTTDYIVFGYVRYAGTASLNGTKPVWNRSRYINVTNPWNDPHGEDPSWWFSAGGSTYGVGYLRVVDAENAVSYNYQNTPSSSPAQLGASGVVLWGDFNNLDWTFTFATAHNSRAPFKSWQDGININYVTGVNEVMADGHAKWHSTANSADGMQYTYDGQQGTWIVGDGY